MTRGAMLPFRLGDWLVNPTTGRLTTNTGQGVPLRPKVMKLLTYFVSRPGELLSIEDIIADVWGGVHVSDASLYYTVNKLRTALGDDRHQPQFIETIPKRGYRLIAKVTSAEDTDAPRSIAVLPFVNMSTDTEQVYFSDGISEELLNLLAKISNVRVAARVSSFKFRGDGFELSEIARALNVAYILEGSVRKAGKRVRITAQLIECSTGYHLWSETYDRTLDDIFAIQDEISAAIVGELKEFLLPGVAAPVTKRTESIEAYDLFLLGREHAAQRRYGPMAASLDYFERSLALDPLFAPSLVGLANSIVLLSNVAGAYGMTPLEEAVKRAEPFLKKAEEINPDSPELYEAYAVFYRLKHDFERSAAAAEKAIKLNPSSAKGHNYLYFARMYVGDPSIGVLFYTRKALAVDPMNIVSLCNVSDGLCQNLRITEAAKFLDRAEAIDPTRSSTIFRRVEWLNAQGRYMDALAHGLKNEKYYLDALHISCIGAQTFLLGEGRKIDAMEPIVSLWWYYFMGDIDGIHRCLDILEMTVPPYTNYRADVLTAAVAAQEGQYEEALEILSYYEHSDTDKWGHHFGDEEEYLGARLSVYVRRKLGLNVEADLYLERLKRAYDLNQSNPEGPYGWMECIGVYIALDEGRIEDALDHLERQAAMSPRMVLRLKGPSLYEDLNDQPRFIAVMAEFDAHVAAEKNKAEALNLLPIDGAPYAKYLAKVQ